MKKLLMVRTYEPLETRGLMMVVDGFNKLFECKCLELPDKNNQKEISCIPEGIYPVKKVISDKFGRAFLLSNVPNRSAVMIHIGNFASGKKIDTHGCILPGMRFADANGDGILDVVESTTAMNKLLEELPDEFLLYVL